MCGIQIKIPAQSALENIQRAGHSYEARAELLG